ncbi:MAG: YciI family protein [Parvularculaceae bacterium]
MSEFIIICHDKKDQFELRAATRAEHLGYFESAGEKGILAGPMLDEEGRPMGSMIIIEAENLDAAKAFAANDPYAKAGLFEATEVRPYKLVKGSLLEKK